MPKPRPLAPEKFVVEIVEGKAAESFLSELHALVERGHGDLLAGDPPGAYSDDEAADGSSTPKAQTGRLS